MTWKMLAVTCAISIAGAAFAEQPDKWVRYVEATGSQYVDTGITGRWNTKAECKVEWMGFSDSSFLASRKGVYPTNERMYFCYCLDAVGVMYAAQGVGESVNWWQEGATWYCRFETNRVYTYTSEFTPTNGEGKATNKITVDGINVMNKERAGINTDFNLYIFANNQDDNAVSYSKSRCYGLKLWQGPIDGGEMKLVRDFYPCMKDGKAGLYDAVSSNIFYSASGDLVCDENSEEPDEYIEYVESMGTDADYSGAQYPQYPPYLDTGIIGRSGTKMSGEFAILASEDKGFLGSRDNTKDDALCRFYLLQSYNSKMTCGYGTHKSNSYTLETGKKYWVETELDVGKQTQKIGADGVTNTVLSATASTAIDTGCPMYLFTCNINGTPTWFSKARCYGFKIWQDGALVRDYRPCLKNGVAGLYDDVTKRIYYSSGIPFTYETRKVVKPKEVLFVDYIESDGNNTLDTYVPARSGTRAKGEMAWTQAGDDADGKMRAWNQECYRYLEYTGSPNVYYRQLHSYLSAVTKGDTRFWMVHSYSKGLYAAYGSGGNALIAAKINDESVLPIVNVKHSFDVTLNNGSQTMKWNDETVISTNITGNVDIGDTLHLFSSSYWRFRSAARCYGLQIWQDGNLVRDFKPCIYQNKGMLYDTVTKMVYRPSPDIPVSRTGAMIFTGKEQPAQYVDYVETDGTIFVDTGVRGRSGTKADLKMQFQQNADSSFLDTRNDNLGDSVARRFYMWHNYTDHSSNNMGYGYGAWNQLVGTFATNTDYHVVSSLFAGSQSVTINGVPYSNTSGNMSNGTEVDTALDMYLFACNRLEASKVNSYPTWASKTRFYWLKIYQGDMNGGNLQLVRDYKPVRLTNGLVVLWDFVEKKAYPAQSMTAPYAYTRFSAVGPDGEGIYDGTRIIFR